MSSTNGKADTSTETSSDTGAENPPQTPSEETPAAKKSKALFSKKFNMSFNMKKFGTSSAAPEAPKPAAVDEKSEDSDSKSNKTDEKAIQDNLLGVIQKIRHGYEEQLLMGTTTLNSQIAPSSPSDTPVLKPPVTTTILIQEDRPDSGGVADLFEGKVGTLGQQADLIEKCAPVWLADVLLRNQTPAKDIVKVSFILEPYQNLLPSISSDGNNRLNANRMLRARKILAYVAERIEPAPEEGEELMKPEEYLELYCQNQLISPTMTLASIRTHIWRGGSDVVLYYKANGRKEIKTQVPGAPRAAGSAFGSEGKVSSEAGRSSQQSSRGVSEGKASG